MRLATEQGGARALFEAKLSNAFRQIFAATTRRTVEMKFNIHPKLSISFISDANGFGA